MEEQNELTELTAQEIKAEALRVAAIVFRNALTAMSDNNVIADDLSLDFGQDDDGKQLGRITFIFSTDKTVEEVRTIMEEGVTENVR